MGPKLDHAQNHPGGLLNADRRLGPTAQVCDSVGRGWESAFPTSSQVMLLV